MFLHFAIGQCNAVDRATQEFRQESDIVGLWLAECVAVAPGQIVFEDDLYKCYREWCIDNGERIILSQNKLTRILLDKRYQKDANKRSRPTEVRKRVWMDLELTAEGRSYLT